MCPCSPGSVYSVTTGIQTQRCVLHPPKCKQESRRPFCLVESPTRVKKRTENKEAAGNASRERQPGTPAKQPLLQSENEGNGTSLFICLWGVFDSELHPSVPSKPEHNYTELRVMQISSEDFREASTKAAVSINRIHGWFFYSCYSRVGICDVIPKWICMT